MASTPTSGFIVHIYKSEINEIRKYQGQTRVGDLFGLWTISGDVVVQLAVGVSLCGACRQESEQDLKNYLEKKHMLCHVGKWKYDPNLTSTTIAAGEPDRATLTTVHSYCGNGYKACVLLSLCGRGNEGNVQPYLFLEGGTQHISGTINILLGNESSDEALNNPLRNIQAIREMLEKQNRVVQTNRQHLAGGHDARVNAHNTNSDSWVSWMTFEDENTSPAGNPLARTQHTGPNSAKNIYLNSSTSPQPASPTSAQLSFSLRPTSTSSPQLPSFPANQNTSRKSSNAIPETAPNFLNTSSGSKIFEEILGKICSMAGDGQKVDVKPTPGSIQLIFEFNGGSHQIKFPKAFPEEPATILRNHKSFTANKKLDTSASILSTLSSGTPGFPSANTSALSCVHQPAATVPSKPSKVVDVPSNKSNDLRDNIFEFSKEICKKLKETFNISGDVNTQVKDDKSGKSVEFAFEHYNKTWLVAIPVEFPEKPARFFHVTAYCGNRRYELRPKSGKSISNLPEIISELKYQCTCGLCLKSRNDTWV